MEAALRLGVPVTVGISAIACGMAWVTRYRTVASLATEGLILTRVAGIPARSRPVFCHSNP